MRKLAIKIVILLLVVYAPVIGINYIVDPANLFHQDMIPKAVSELTSGNIIESPGDMDEGALQEQMLSSIEYEPDTIVVGSSHVMYLPWEYDNYYLGGMSGAYLGDYYAIMGLLEENQITPKRVVIGVDPWAFSKPYSDGRHVSISRYAVAEHQLIKGEGFVLDDASNESLDKLEELASFPYFQSSVSALKSYDVGYYLSQQRSNVVVCTDDRVGNINKILPNGQLVMGTSEYATMEKNDSAAQLAIYTKSIDRLGSGLKVIDQDTFDDFRLLIKYLMEQGIEVELYLPSWYPTIYDYFESEEAYAGVIELEEMVRDLGREYGCTVHGSYDPDLTGVTKDDFANWKHLKPNKMLENYKVVLDDTRH